MKITTAVLLSALSPLAVAAALTTTTAGALPSMSAGETSAVQRASAIGRQLFDYDQAASVSTDALLGKVPPERLSTVRGWVVEPGAGGTLAATYYSGDGAAHRAVFVATIAVGKVTSSRLIADDAAAALTPGQERLAAALSTARSYAEAKGWKPCTPARFNTVVLPPASAVAPVSVYLLTAQVRASELPFGGHYRLDVDRDGRVVGERPFMKACLTMPRPGPGAVGVVVSHLLDLTPTELHVFTSLAARLPVFVATADKRSWQVDGASITLMQKEGSRQ
jgi:hypothetical protein